MSELLSLDPGVSLLEASAGTGKTWQITQLMVRLLTEVQPRIRIGEIVVVTFTRAATAELVDRIRLRLAEATSALAGGTSDDPAFASLIERAGAHREEWHRRLIEAQEEFDQALISTIHGFCQRMLEQNAFESGAGFGVTLQTDDAALRQEVVDDWLSAQVNCAPPERYDFLVGSVGIKRDALLDLVGKAVSDPDMPLVTGGGQAPGDPDELRDRAARLAASLASGDLALLGDAVDAAKDVKSTPRDQVRFKPRQRTYNRKNVVGQRGQALIEWLGAVGGGDLGTPLDDKTQQLFSNEHLDKYLAPEQVFDHPIWVRICSLIEDIQVFVDAQHAEIWADFARYAREQVQRRQQAAQSMSFHDLLRQLRLALPAPAQPHNALSQAISKRYRAALIDEFQDTDRMQWQIFASLFGRGQHRLFLIGDPKQAIYGFRGANIHVYTAARRQAGGITTMDTNFRSDPRYVAALNGLMGQHGDSLFGDPEICYEPVNAAITEDRLWSPAGALPALQVRFLQLGEDADGRQAPLAKTSVSDDLPRRVAHDIVDFLDAGLRIEERPVQPGDIAVLVRTGLQARAVHRALLDAGVPAVLPGAESVLHSTEALELLQCLQVAARPGDDGLARTVAVSSLFGWQLSDLLAIEGDLDTRDRWDAWVGDIATWRERIEQRGVLRVFRRIMDRWDVVDRLAGFADGERRLTNLLHLLELLHAEQVSSRAGVAGLVTWLARARVEASTDEELTELRLETDAAAVRVLTMHKSKGLQFPVVWAPYLWDGRRLSATEESRLIVPDLQHPDQRLLDLRPRRSKADAIARAQAEQSREAVRLLYVALTRARHHTVLYTGAISPSRPSGVGASAVGLLLHSLRPDDPSVSPEQRFLDVGQRVAASSPEDLWEDLLLWADHVGDGLIGVQASSIQVPAPTWRPPVVPAPALAPEVFARDGVDLDWRRLSYTSIVRGRRVSVADDDPRDHDQHVDEDASVAAASPAAQLPPPEPDEQDVPLAAFPPGAEAGTFLHRLFELHDFQDPGSLDELIQQQAASYGFDAWTPLLSAALPQVLQTPMGGALGGLRLADLPADQRLNELEFDLPVAGGDDHGTAVLEPLDGARFGQAFGLDPTLDRDYVEALGRAWQGQRFAGYLTGSIDLVFRADGRFWVADYKSNRLDLLRTAEHPPRHFCQAWMHHEMMHHDYVVQYHLYTVALHRYLRHRLPDYDYDSHIGGACYLFIRGMVGADTAVEADGARRGVYIRRPDRRVIERLDALFTGGEA